MANKKRVRTKFEKNQLSNMVAVGEVGPTFARIWMRSDSPGKIKVVIHPPGKPHLKKEHHVTIDDKARDLTQTVLIRGLDPLTRYKYKVVRLSDKDLFGSGQFETFPGKQEDTPEKFSIALMSCHQPFNQDNFRVEERRMRLLKVAKKILADHDAKFILLAGDQMYSDVPYERSLFYKHYTEKWNIPAGPSIIDWDMQTVRRAYQERYRIFWHMKEVKHFYANYPCFPILDDHEIVDDWGAKEIHSIKKYRNIRNGAREAYFDYQGSRVTERRKKLPSSFHYSFTYGNVGIFVFDLRSQRKAGKKWELFNTSQLRDFEKFLTNNQDKRVLIIMVSVPVVHLPEWLSDIGAALAGHKVDFPDHWSYRKNRGDRDRFLKLIHSHQVENPRQRVILVSGDVHIGCVFKIKWEGRGRKPILYQFTSSAISNRMKKSETEISEFVTGLAGKIKCKNGLKAKTSLLESKDRVHNNQNPFGGLNVGIIEIHDEGKESRVTLKLIGYPEGDHDKHVDFFISKRL